MQANYQRKDTVGHKWYGIRSQSSLPGRRLQKRATAQGLHVQNSTPERPVFTGLGNSGTHEHLVSPKMHRTSPCLADCPNQSRPDKRGGRQRASGPGSCREAGKNTELGNRRPRLQGPSLSRNGPRGEHWQAVKAFRVPLRDKEGQSALGGVGGAAREAGPEYAARSFCARQGGRADLRAPDRALRLAAAQSLARKVCPRATCQRRLRPCCRPPSVHPPAASIFRCSLGLIQPF